ATALTDAVAFADATATDTQSYTGVAAAISLNVALVDNNATVGAGATLAGGSLEIGAVTPEGEHNTFQARALSGAAAQSTAVGGSIGVNYVEMDNHATVGNGATLTASTGDIEVAARSPSEIQNITGGAALALGSSGTGVGVAVSVNIFTQNTSATLGDDVTADAAGSVVVSSTAALVPISEDLPVIGELAITSFAASGAISTGQSAVAGSAGVNVFLLDTQASIGARGDIDAQDDVTVSATDTLTMRTGAGSIGATVGSGSGIGIGLDVGVVTRATSASVGASTDVDAGGDIAVSATSDDDIKSIAASFGVAA